MAEQAKTPTLVLRVVGPLEVLAGGTAVNMPPSKKTRALLAFLAVTPRPQRRERLCEIFWDLPDDPKGALRWSLSKIRQAINCDNIDRLITDRESVRLDRDGVSVDWLELADAQEKGFEQFSTERLEALAGNIRGGFLEGLSLPRCQDFEAWRTAEAARVEIVSVRLLQHLVQRLGAEPERALRHATMLRSLRTDDRELESLIATLRHAALAGGEDHATATPGETPDVPNVATPRPKTDEPKLPTIAILPFANHSGDQSQEFISDGIAEDVTTELGRFRALRVIARNSSFAYRGNVVRPDQLGAELGADYVVEGSVRRAGSRLRISTQLTETETGRQLWAERYDRELNDVFALQDEIARTIAAAIVPELSTQELARAHRKSPANLTSWDWYQQGMSSLYRDSKEGNRTALFQFSRSAELSPGFAPPLAAAAHVIFNDLISGHRAITAASISEAFQFAERAVAADSRDAMAHMVLGRLNLLRRRHADSISELETSIELNPSYADAHYGLGFTLVYSGRAEDAIPRFDMAIRLSPYDPRVSSFYEMQAWALLIRGQAAEAVSFARTSVRRPNAQHWAYATLCAVLGHLGEQEEARGVLEELLRLKPDFSARFVREYVYYNKEPAELDYFIEGLLLAGAPR